MKRQPSLPVAATLADVATELAEQARKLTGLASEAGGEELAARSRTKRARDTVGTARLVKQDRDLQLLREQIEDLAAQAWALQWRHDNESSDLGTPADDDRRQPDVDDPALGPSPRTASTSAQDRGEQR